MNAKSANPPTPPGIVRVLAAGVFGMATGAALIGYGFFHGWGVAGWLGVGFLSGSPPLAVLAATRHLPAIRPAMRRYNARLMLNMAVYVVLLLVGVELFNRGLVTGWLGYPAAALPALPIVNILVIMARFLREETDEVQRHILTTALVWAGALTLGEATVWGFLEMFGKAPHVWMWAAPVLFFMQLGATLPLAHKRYA